MSPSEPVALVRGLGGAPRIGATVPAERAADTPVPGCGRLDDRGIALDIPLRGFARLRVQRPDPDPFIGAVEGSIDRPYRHPPRRAA
ncbi:hypothetical protein MKK69_26575 [Methylobacterium sp. J-026]|uniref:hypothetical protein n=1 Tax=Methylobacterium sp. J-026 TaxID=2836624 RepID=UPI001FBB3076|nr:hypothetical protein [Methylobacterium sp. J-026]MCJ2137566.1 hypothetical protein [Methylobacterium sp. J-026]